MDNRAFLWFDDRFYVLSKDEILKAQNEGKKVSDKIISKILSGNDEIYFPSSTTILGASPKPWLATWRGQLGNTEADRVMNEAMQKGSSIHNAIHIWLEGGLVIYNNPRKPSYTEEEITNMTEGKPFIVLREQQEHLEVYKLVQWFSAVNPTVLASEFTVVSLEHGYAGTGDLLIHIAGGKYDINGSKPLVLESGIYVVDYKTGNTFDKANYYRQVASYSYAIEESGEHQITGALIIHTNDNAIKKGIEGLKTYAVTKDELKQSLDEFLKIKAVYEIDLDYQPKVIELPTVLVRKEVKAA